SAGNRATAAGRRGTALANSALVGGFRETLLAVEDNTGDDIDIVNTFVYCLPTADEGPERRPSDLRDAKNRRPTRRIARIRDNRPQKRDFSTP
ncbi:MAG: hypothetical protein ABI852_15575, partial [Gemmatimonadaceae bacterium]